MISEDTSFEVLSDHYKDSFEHLLEHRRFRDRLFRFILLVMTTMVFQLYSPAEATQAISDLATQKLELTSPIDSSFVASMVWFALLAFTVRYYQAVIVLERQYDYIHKLESVLSQNYEGKAFTREGAAYLADYPLFSKWASKLYTVAFPLLLVILVIAKIVSELCEAPRVSVTLGFDVVVSILVLISIVLSMTSLHRRRSTEVPSGLDAA